MKLFVDDIRNAPDDTWTVARTVTGAIRAIAHFNFSEISLDHDISHQVSVSKLSRHYPCEETFMAVVYFLAEKYWTQKQLKGTKGILRPGIYPKITLHTSNQVAGEEMAAVLKDAGIECEKKYMGAANRLEMEV